MQQAVKRPYDSSTRRERSAATRQRILDQARERFVRDGYRAATVAAIAEGAGVNIDTVYRLVGRKPAMFRALIEQAISGTDHPVEAEQRAHVIAMRAEPDPTVKLAIYARALSDTHERLAPLFLAARDAASTEPDVAEVWQQISDRRAANMRKLVADLRTGIDGPFALSLERAADVAWALYGPELYLMLTAERGWPKAEYERFLVDGMAPILLGLRSPVRRVARKPRR